MKIFHLTAGTGSFFCGTCLRDNALVAGLRSLGVDAHMVPMYLPLVVDEPSTADTPVFMGGVNVYLQQASSIFRHTPRFIDALLDSPFVLKLASRRAGASQAADLGALTLSMLQGEHGHQAKELDRLVDGLGRLGAEPGDWVCISNALLAGLARRLKEHLGVRVACTLQGEDTFLDAMPQPWRDQSWAAVAERVREIDALVAVSHYYAGVMSRRLELPPDRLRVVWNGIALDGYPEPGTRVRPEPPVVGYFARMCRDKGLHTLVDAFIRLRTKPQHATARLMVAGAVTAADESFVREQKDRLAAAGLADAAEFRPNVDRARKIELLRGLSVFSVPATYGESFGLYVIEALASGVPVVEPRHGGFPEVVSATGGGLLCAPDDPQALADALGSILEDDPRREELGVRGQKAVRERFNVQRMAADFLAALRMESERPVQSAAALAG
jgi:glycosyltransferase involved in cell wall biosynthesis